MIVKLKRNADLKDIQALKDHLTGMGFEIHESVGETYSLFGVVGDTAKFDIRSLYAFLCVDKVIRVHTD